MILLALIANSPQVILSFLYFAYNSLFTAMLMGQEWTSYASKRKGLRVSRKSSGFQRSTYFLQLPYRFGIPLVILSGTLHWLVSQSIFVVAFDVYDDHGKPVENGISLRDNIVTKTCGYSLIAMLAILVLGLLVVIALVGAGYVPYRRNIPLTGSCSLAISATCHSEKDLQVEGDVLSQKKLQWGVVSTDADGVGHCVLQQASQTGGERMYVHLKKPSDGIFSRGKSYLPVLSQGIE
ncbi:hypothetical protein BDU57DRAFT_152490 [Ampelomyces quisqualis]|uniref:Uncharacterized protein n=1 Tax=Ampelomyces quisqualis TaxID=50730 RepID=A0A6A5QVL8_AMPQU|nr:hypothetical protein BDU57DRAFT_152490 [Ampelomyces quisqualis]